MEKKREKTVILSSSGTRAKKRKRRKWPIVLFSVFLVLVCLYLIAVYSNIPFIKRMRTLYIETAMNTFTHKWLATAFIPKGVIDQVMEDLDKVLEENKVPESDLPPGPTSAPPTTPRPSVTTQPSPTEKPDMGLDALIALFWEIDPATVPEDLDCHDLQIKDIEDLGIKTTAGDAVWAIDMPNGILIMTVEGKASGVSYKGKLAIVRDSSRVMLAVNDRAGYGRNVTQFCSRNGAVLGINAGGFVDPEGTGKGDIPVGLVLAEGKIINEPIGGNYQICGYDYDYNLRRGYDVDLTTLKYAVEFMPIVVLNGKNALKGTTGMGIQPRTVIGQAADKSTLFLIIDGRQPTHSVGTTLPECAEILLRYNCFNAMTMDSGSSASMTYMGEMITKTSSPTKTGRTLPNAWVVKGTWPEE